MARTRITHTVLKPDAGNSNALLPAAGASITIRKRSDNSLATVYSGETGGSTVANPIATDSEGRVSAWVDRGAYNLVVSGTGIAGYTMPFDAAPASDQGIDTPWIGTAALPVGAIQLFGGSSDPSSNWLICDGRAVSRTTYATLFSAIGTTYGAGDGSTTFNLPDFRGRVPVGKGTHADVDTLGENDGAALGSRTPKHTHADGSLAAAPHTHQHVSPISLRGGDIRVVPPHATMLDGTGSYGQTDTVTDLGWQFAGVGSSDLQERWIVTSSSNGADVTGSTSTGSSSYLVVTFIIRAL